MNSMKLRKNAGYRFFDDFNCYKITGENCEEILEYYLSKSVEFADEMTVNFHFALNSNAEIISEVILYKLEDEFLFFSNNHFSQIIKETHGLQIEELDNLNILQIEGISSPNIISQIESEEDLETLEFKDVISTEFAGTKIYLSRFGFTGEFGYQIILPKYKNKEIIDNVFSDISTLQIDNYTYSLFEVGHPLKKLYTSNEYNLCELGYLWNIDFTKDNFVGREKLLEQLEHSQNHIIGFKSDNIVKVDEDVFFDGISVGTVILVYEDFDNKIYRGLLMLKESFAHSNINFSLENNSVIKTLSSPYTIPESWKKDEF